MISILREGKNITDFSDMDQNIPTVEVNMNSNTSVINHEEIGNDQYIKLNTDQKIVVDTVLQAIENNQKESRCIYIDGLAGTGKTFIYTTVYYILKSRGKLVKTMAFTGIAAILLPDGKTVHKTFGLGVPIFSDSTSSFGIESPEAIELKNMDVIIWDEAPMAPRYALEVIDRTLKDIMKNNLPFGGKIMILGGDFRQLLPVKKGHTR